MYFVGNRSTLEHAEHWRSMISNMAEKGCVGPTITVCCPDHPISTIIRVTTADQMPFSAFCREDCNQSMPCRMHLCQRKCQPPHSHMVCHEKIGFIFPACNHLGKRECYQDQMKIKCTKRITFQHERCGHLGERECSQSECDIRCREKCRKILACKGAHPCPGKCSEPCDPENCPECVKIKKAEEQRKKQEEERVRQQVRRDTQQKINQIRKTNSVPERIDLLPDGDSKAEYLEIEDQVIKYVQPGHNWCPKVIRIEKINNSKLEEKWLECKMKRFDPTRTALKFHGTSTEAVNAIVENGFKMGNPGMYGAGIYFATDSSKSAQEIYTKGSNQLLLCDVILGKSKTVDGARRSMNLQKLKAEGYDSLFAPRNTRGTGGVLYDEFVVYDVNQALPRYIIHYRQLGHIDLTSIDVKSSGFKKFSIKPQRQLSPDDTLDQHFRIAESQFMRMSTHRRQVSQVDYYVNAHLVKIFQQKMDDFKSRGVDSRFILGFHGTSSNNIDAIVKKNFDMSQIIRAAHGRGIYFSEFPDVSIGYAQGSNQLLLCRVLPGKSYDGSAGVMGNIPHGYDSIRVSQGSQGQGWAIVIDNADQILPCYVITHT